MCEPMTGLRHRQFTERLKASFECKHVNSTVDTGEFNGDKFELHVTCTDCLSKLKFILPVRLLFGMMRNETETIVHHEPMPENWCGEGMI